MPSLPQHGHVRSASHRARWLVPSTCGTPLCSGPAALTVVKRFWYSDVDHVRSCFTSEAISDQIGMFSHQLHHSGQPRVQNGPLMTMQTALKKTAAIARKRPRRWMPSEPIE
jgi:hypothetical protein